MIARTIDYTDYRTFDGFHTTHNYLYKCFRDLPNFLTYNDNLYELKVICHFHNDELPTHYDIWYVNKWFNDFPYEMNNVFDISKGVQEMLNLIKDIQIADCKKLKGLIYRISHLKTPKVYIGQTIQPFRDRKAYYKNTKGHNKHLKNAFNKYGFDTFIFDIIDKTDNIQDLNCKEVYWIEFYESNNPKKGYNMLIGGNNKKMAQATKNIKSEQMKGDKNHQFGKVRSEEERSEISERSKIATAHLVGTKRDPKTIEKVAKTKQEQSGKKVAQYLRSTGEIIKVYPSIGMAKVDGNEGTISRHCNNKVKIYINDISWKFITKEQYDNFLK